MKTLHTLLAASVTLAISASAVATELTVNDVTFSPYARVVGGISYINHGYDAGETGSLTEVASNQWGTSYFGAKLSVKLDDHFTGIANVESGFGTLNGETNVEDTLFNRQANVGIAHDQYGQLTFGTHLMLSQDIIDMDPMRFQSIGINTLVNGINDTFAENSVVYRSANYAGFEFAAMQKFGGEVSDSERAKAQAVSLHYQNGGLAVRAIWQASTDEFGRYTGGEYYGLGTQTQWLYAKTAIVAASYQLADTKISAGFEQIKADDAGYLLSYTFDDAADMGWVGVNYQINDKLVANAAFYRITMSYSGKQSNLYALGLNYEFNQHFTFYSTLGYIGNNAISSTFTSDVGVNNHSLDYNEVACEDTADCNGASQLGGYFGVVLSL